VTGGELAHVERLAAGGKLAVKLLAVPGGKTAEPVTLGLKRQRRDRRRGRDKHGRRRGQRACRAGKFGVRMNGLGKEHGHRTCDPDHGGSASQEIDPQGNPSSRYAGSAIDWHSDILPDQPGGFLRGVKEFAGTKESVPSKLLAKLFILLDFDSSRFPGPLTLFRIRISANLMVVSQFEERSFLRG
jgi:hypothetical protein